MKITIVIPTIMGREKILLSLLATLIGQTYTDWDLIICTTNPDIKATKREDPNFINTFLVTINQLGHEVSVIHDTKCSGPGQAVQQLLDAAQTNCVFRVDDDVILTPKVLQKLVATYALDPIGTGAVAAPVNGFGVCPVSYEKYWNKELVRWRPHLHGNGSYEEMNDNCMHHGCIESYAIAEVDFLSGYCLLLDKKKTEEVGGYVDEKSPHHHKEDWYGTLKLKAKGYRLLIRADALAFHRHYEKDESDSYRTNRSEKDHQLFAEYKNSISLPKDRKIGIINYEP